MTRERVIIHRAIAEVNGQNLFYLDTLSSNPPMLYLHGRWGRAQTWTDIIYRYGDRWRVIAPDQRGHGLSSKPEHGYTPEEMADDAAALMDHLNCGPAVVVGHSMGGRIAAYLTARYPDRVRAVAILDVSAAGDSPEVRQEDDGLTKNWPTPFATYQDAEDFLRLTFARETNVRYFLDSLVETVGGFDFMFSRKAMVELHNAQSDWFDILPQLKCPVCLVRAGESLFFSADDAARMREHIDDCAYFEVLDSDHAVYSDDPAAFFPHFDAFLARVI